MISEADTFLGGRVRVAQPEEGFRSGLDAVVLAAAVPARAGQTALELGAGAGTASLCLAARAPGVTITGVELSANLTMLANRNTGENGMTDRVSFANADVFAMPPGLRRDFDHVFVNPPFHGEGRSPANDVRDLALKDKGKLTDWMKLGLQRTVSDGYFTAILRADRLNEVLAALPLGGINIFPLWPRAGEPAKRVILQVRKGSNTPLALLPGLILHDAAGAYTQEADAVLRRGGALALAGVAG
jgi:tRNA1(Val) A37 N6-methylase TrmN6